MQSLDLEVLIQIERWLGAGREPWLCTIIAATGSSPRPVGSMLGYCDEQLVGTLSGGCVEEDLLARLSAGEISTDTPQRVEYGVSAEENERLGLPCGGRLEVLIEHFGDPHGSWIGEAVQALNARKTVRRRVELATGRTEFSIVPSFQPLTLSATHLEQSLGPKMRMLLIGAGQLAQVLSQLALAMDFDVVVTDPREHAIAQWAGPEVTLINGLPDDVIAAQAADDQTVIITLTHDPRIDDMALMEALETKAWYVGALGSPKTTEGRLKRLAQLGIDQDSIARLHAPVGLPIGSKTPMEIAVAIMAELTQLRRAQLREQALIQ